MIMFVYAIPSAVAHVRPGGAHIVHIKKLDAANCAVCIHHQYIYAPVVITNKCAVFFATTHLSVGSIIIWHAHRHVDGAVAIKVP